MSTFKKSHFCGLHLSINFEANKYLKKIIAKSKFPGPMRNSCVKMKGGIWYDSQDYIRIFNSCSIVKLTSNRNQLDKKTFRFSMISLSNFTSLFCFFGFAAIFHAYIFLHLPCSRTSPLRLDYQKRWCA